MKISRNMLVEMAMQIYEEHNDLRIQRPAVMLEHRRQPNHLTRRQKILLKESLRQHMLNEGFLDKVGSFFSGAKEAVTSFIDSWKDAPKRWNQISPIVKKDSQRIVSNLNDITEGEADFDPVQNYIMVFAMVKSCMSDSMKSLKKRYAGWRNMAERDINGLLKGEEAGALFGAFGMLNVDDIEKAVRQLSDKDVEQNQSLINFLQGVKSKYKEIVRTENAIQKALRVASRNADRSRKGWEDPKSRKIMQELDKSGGPLDKLEDLMGDLVMAL